MSLYGSYDYQNMSKKVVVIYMGFGHRLKQKKDKNSLNIYPIPIFGSCCDTLIVNVFSLFKQKYQMKKSYEISLLHIVPFCERPNKKPEGFAKKKNLPYLRCDTHCTLWCTTHR